ncbi:flagellar protein FliT [Lachnospiraceae bacterium ZAX-1]
MQKSDYIVILIEGLGKKIEILDKMIEKNKVQKLILSEDEIEADDFESNLDEKSELIDLLNQLDDGFEQVYTRVRKDIKGNQELYQEEIAIMQEMITKITEKSNTIQVQEQRNRVLAERQFAISKDKVRQVQSSRKVASQYYQNMTKLNYVDPQFMDQKK